MASTWMITTGTIHPGEFINTGPVELYRVAHIWMTHAGTICTGVSFIGFIHTGDLDMRVTCIGRIPGMSMIHMFHISSIVNAGVTQLEFDIPECLKWSVLELILTMSSTISSARSSTEESPKEFPSSFINDYKEKSQCGEVWRRPSIHQATFRVVELKTV